MVWMKRLGMQWKLTLQVFMTFIVLFGVSLYFLSKISPNALNYPDGSDFALDFQYWGNIDSKCDVQKMQFRLKEILNIKSSVSNELLDLQSKRSNLQVEISSLTQTIENLKKEHHFHSTELRRVKFSLERIKLVQKAQLEKQISELSLTRCVKSSARQPEITVNLIPEEGKPTCTMSTCFSHSRCPMNSPFSIFIYKKAQYPFLDDNARVFIEILKKNPYVTEDAHAACLFVVVLSANMSQPETIENLLKSLPFWGSDGQNHLLITMQSANQDFLYKVNTGQALKAQTFFRSASFRKNFDILLPPISYLLQSHEKETPFPSPAWRNVFLSFSGTWSGNFTEDPILSDIHSLLNKPPGHELLINSSCRAERKALFNEDNDWFLCENQNDRHRILAESTFALLVAPFSEFLTFSIDFQIRLLESLMAGAIPVILANNVELPFAEFVDWQKASILLFRSQVSGIPYVLGNIADADVFFLRRQGHLLWQSYLRSADVVAFTLLTLIRQRLGLAALPVEDIPALGVFNGSSNPAKLHVAEVETELDPENLGPVEIPYPSIRFLRNVTVHRLHQYEFWNIVADPFTMYPSLPFDPVIPSEASILGSSAGFQNIAHGAGGSGKEFSEALGGDVPQEQFTIVLLTYERLGTLLQTLSHLHGLPHLNRVLIIWNSPNLPDIHTSWPDIGVPIHVIRTHKNSLNNRFLPYDVIETDAVLSLDDDIHLRHDEIVFAFRVWREMRDRLVGFPGRYHSWVGYWKYKSDHACELSMVLTGAAFLHKYYFYAYSYLMPQKIRDLVDQVQNCEDIAMNFLVAHMTRKPPIKVTSRWTFTCPSCPLALSDAQEHFDERHMCVNKLSQMYGYTPLRRTQFRVDSILFKTRVPVDKQKCFRYV